MFCDALSNATNKMRLKYPDYGECLELKNQMIGWSDAFYVHSRDVNSVSMTVSYTHLHIDWSRLE